MNRYFTNRQGAIRRIVNIKRDVNQARRATIICKQKDGTEIHGLEQVLLNLRVGRIAYFVCRSPF
ncbi:hypothetical protein AWB74_07878 [Caballeronia arvi]|uniref:Uncharacterized protein n=1 Tax=Caballeronia arvi TaxID=1777135 RepID=A0A158L212_9BURK|nr:hypothetical protein [Caballeronia arvi]SAL86870.1 hypothetical protein AWB74_07878 [Caballeronia arvi]